MLVLYYQYYIYGCAYCSSHPSLCVCLSPCFPEQPPSVSVSQTHPSKQMVESRGLL